MEQTNKMGTAKMGPLLLSMALPAMVSMLINALYNIVDSIFVARYATDALTATSLVFPLQQLVIAVAVGTGIGVNSLIARRLGERRAEDANHAAEHGLMLSIVSGVVFIIIGLFCSKAFLQLFNPDEAVLTAAVQYSRIAVGGSIFVMISIMCEKIQQSTGDMLIPMCQGVIGAIVNVILDPLLIFGIGPFPEWGIKGAAIATIIGQIVGMFVGLWGVFVHQKTLNLTLKTFTDGQFKWKKHTVLDIYRVGLPGIIMQSVASVMVAGMNMILIGFSNIAVSVLGVYFKLQTFIFMPVFGLSQGALPIIGYNYGAKNKKRMLSAYKIALVGAVAIMGIGLVLFQTIPDTMIRLFNDDPEMLAVGIPALRTISLSFVGAAFGIINSTLFQAVGRGVASLIVSVCRQLVIILPAAWILGNFYGLSQVWYSFPIAEVAAVIISYLFFFYIHRNDIRFLGEGKGE